MLRRLLPRRRFLAAAATAASSGSDAAVRNLLHSHGLTQPQIASILAKHPSLLAAADIEPTLSTLSSFGLSPGQIAADPSILAVPLSSRILPNLRTLEQALHSRRNVVAALRGSSWLLRHDLDDCVVPNLELLKAKDVPLSNVVKLLTAFPAAMVVPPQRFAQGVERILQLGIGSESATFTFALSVMLGMSEDAWEQKIELYRSLGWTEKTAMEAFARDPKCMLAAEDKIRKAMEFFLGTVKWKPAFLADHPTLLSLNLEARVIPRCAVLNVLAKKGLLKNQMALHNVLLLTEKEFAARYVDRFADKAPEVVDAHKGKTKLVKIHPGVPGVQMQH